VDEAVPRKHSALRGAGEDGVGKFRFQTLSSKSKNTTKKRDFKRGGVMEKGRNGKVPTEGKRGRHNSNPGTTTRPAGIRRGTDVRRLKFSY